MRLAALTAAVLLLLSPWAAATPPAPPRGLAAIVVGIRRGECAPHLDTLRRIAEVATPTGARAAYLLGYCLRTLRRFDDARAAYLAAAARHPALTGYARFYAARSALDLGDPAGAVRILSIAPRGSSTLAQRWALLRAEALLDAGRPADALAVLRPLVGAVVSDDVAPSLWWLLGQAADGAGDRPAAIRAYGMVWWAFPGHPQADAARQRLRGLMRQRPVPSAEARAERGMRLMAMARMEEAERELTLAVRGPLPADVAVVASYQLGLLRIGTRGAVDAFAQAARHAVGRDRALYWLGQAYFRIGRSGDARAVWDRLVRAYPRSAWSARAVLGLGRTAEARGRWSEADAWYARSAQLAPGSFSADEARWRRGWIRLRTGRYAEAERLFLRYAAAFPDAPRAAGHLYWAGRARMAQGRSAHDLLRRVADRYPLTFYGQRARAQLGMPPPSPLPPPPDTVLPNDAFAPAHDELAALGFAREGAEEAEAATLRREAAALYVRAGDFHAAVTSAEPLVTSALYGGAPVDREIWELAYPRAFFTPVGQMAPRTGVDPYLALAVMREESRFDPGAVSPARAIGLMQLLLSTAQGVLGRPVTPARLMDPEVNIRAGMAYLGRLLEGFDENVPLAVAAYNAGPAGMRRQGGLARTDLDRFVESIPYAETRAYVQRVLQSYGIYRWLDESRIR